MKKYNYPTNKWVITGALFALLATNVSFNPHTQKAGFMDFASTGKTGKINIDDGVTLDVSYYPTGNGEITAIVPRTNTEGKVCDDCGFDRIQLTTNGSNDIGHLNMQLMKVLTEMRSGETAPASTAKAPAAEESNASGDEEAPRELSATEKKLAAIKTRCERRRDDLDQMTCFGDEFTNAIRNRNNRDMDPADVYAFYVDEVQKRIVTVMKDARDIETARLRSAATGRFSEDEDYRDPAEMIREGQRLIDKLLASTPEKFDRLRSNLVQAQADILSYQTKAIRESSQQAINNAGTQVGVNFQYATQRLYNDYLTNTNMVNQRVLGAIQEAQYNGIISVDRQMALQNAYIQNVQNLGNNLFATSAYDPSSMTFPGRTGTQVRGQEVIITDPKTGVSTRGVVSQTANGPVVVSSTTQSPVVVNNGLSADVPSTNVVFGPIVPITQNSLMLQQQLVRTQ